MIIRSVIGVLCGACLIGCAQISNLADSGFSEGIEDDAVALNNAYARSTNSVLTANVLRARDRWPTSYTTLSGITSRPNLETGVEGTFTPLGLGNPPAPFGGSESTVSRSESANAEFSVNPFADGERTDTLYTPTNKSLLAKYWDSGWPIEVLFPLLINSVTLHDLDRFGASAGEPANRAGEDLFIYGDENPRDARLKFVLDSLIRYTPPQTFSYTGNIELSDELTTVAYTYRSWPIEPKLSACVAFPFEAATLFGAEFADTLEARIEAIETASDKTIFIKGGEVQLCDPKPEKANTFLERRCSLSECKDRPAFFRYRLRTFEGIVNFLGECLRKGDGKVCEIGGAQLFSVRTADELANKEEPEDFGVSVEHGGERYYAAKACGALDAGPNGDVCAADNTGAVLSLLTELYLLNQSAEFLKAPETILVQ